MKTLLKLIALFGVIIFLMSCGIALKFLLIIPRLILLLVSRGIIFVIILFIIFCFIVGCIKKN